MSGSADPLEPVSPMHTGTDSEETPASFNDLPFTLCIHHILPRLSCNDLRTWRRLNHTCRNMVAHTLTSLRRLPYTTPIVRDLSVKLAPMLTSIDFSDNSDLEAGPDLFLALSFLPCLKRLSFMGCSSLSPGFITRQLPAAAPGLQDLTLSCTIEPPAAELGDALLKLTVLTSLTLSCTMQFQPSLVAVSGLTSLRQLAVLGSRVLDDDGLLALADLDQLTALVLHQQHSRRTPHVRGHGLLHLQSLSSLQSLSLGCPELSPRHLSLLLNLPALDALDLSACGAAVFRGPGVDTLVGFGARLSQLLLPFAYTRSDAATVAALLAGLPALRGTALRTNASLDATLLGTLAVLTACEALEVLHTTAIGGAAAMDALAPAEPDNIAPAGAMGALLDGGGVDPDPYRALSRAFPYLKALHWVQSGDGPEQAAHNGGDADTLAHNSHFNGGDPGHPDPGGDEAASSTACQRAGGSLVRSAVCRWTQLTSLNLTQACLDDADVAAVAQLSALHSLALGGGRRSLARGFASWPACLQRLANLSLSECRVTDEGLAHIARLPALRQLALLYCGSVEDAGVAALVEGAGPQLGVLRLERLAGVSPAGFGVLGRLKLAGLSLPGCDVTDATLAGMAACAARQHTHPQPLLPQAPTHTSAPTNASAPPLSAQASPQPSPAASGQQQQQQQASGLCYCEFLDLSATHVSSNGIAQCLAPAAKALSHLVVSSCGNVGGESLVALALAAPSLVFLEVAGCALVLPDTHAVLHALGVVVNSGARWEGLGPTAMHAAR